MNSPSPIARQRLEAEALEPFAAVARRMSLQFISGQGASNRLPIRPNVYFQFGDLRVDLPRATILVEVESSGGVTNLAKYWESFASNRISTRIKLLHLFRQKSVNDYEAHLVVWRFLSDRMRAELGDRFESCCLGYRHGSPDSLAPALEVFERWLRENAV